MSPFIARAQIVESENVYGQFRDPTAAELAVIDDYIEKYCRTFGVEPAGSHWIDGVGCLVSLLRKGGIP